MANEVPHFEREFCRFDREIYPRHNSGTFTSFRDVAAAAWEGYKPLLRSKALELLGSDDWRADQIGSGAILTKLIASIEIPGGPQDRNNLVEWEGRFGPSQRHHLPFLRALAGNEPKAPFERWLFDFYVGESDEATAFEAMRHKIGGAYPMLAYLFFLRDMDRFTPIAPQTFDAAFAKLGIDLTTSGRASWANYLQYNDALESVRKRLREKPGLGDARLIDAHSFCWMLVRMDVDDVQGGGRAGPVKFADSRRKSVLEMALQAEQTARYSNGQLIIVTRKNKDMSLSRAALEALIDRLIDAQQGRCALTGLPLQFRGTHSDDACLASLDRINSAGDYADGNLQVVCRFANAWKSDAPDSEFRRLLGLVREVQ
jgi:hypothetical protein